MLLFGLFFSKAIYSQDTIRINFKFGSARLLNAENKKIDNIPLNFDVFQIDSIEYIGMADTVGKSTSNFKLSKKRAVNVSKYALKVLPKNIKYRVSALGEITNKEASQSRQVAIVFHYTNVYQSGSLEESNSKTIDSNCIYIDYTLLNTSHIRLVKKRKNEFIYIESIPIIMEEIPKYFKPFDYDNHYYGEINDEGEFAARKVKWRKRRSGKDWWAMRRYIARVPKAKFDRFKIFSIEKPPCSECHLNVKDSVHNYHLKQERHLDNFVINTFQFKRMFFNRKKVKIRAPREYIDRAVAYYPDKTTNEQIEWTTKRAKRKRPYFYAKIKSRSKEDYLIYRDFSYCYSPPKFAGKSVAEIYPCQKMGVAYEEANNLLLGEYGSTFLNNKLSPYLGAYINNKFASKLEYGLLIGSTYEFKGIGLMRLRFDFYSLGLGRGIKSACMWGKPPSGLTNYWRAKLYLGLENQTELFSNRLNFNENNINLGLEFENIHAQSRFSRYFIQFGQAYTYDTDFIHENQFLIRIGGAIRIITKKNENKN